MYFIFRKAKLFFLFCKVHPVVDLIFILLVGLHIFSWFHGDFLYIGGDYLIPLNPIENLQHLYTWKTQLGGVESWGLNQILVNGFFALFHFLGFSLPTIQQFYIYFSHILAGLFMYYLASTFASGEKDRRAVSLIAAFFYMFSPFMLGLGQINVYLPYVFMPLVLAFYVRGLSDRTNQIRYAFFTALALLGFIGELPQYKMLSIAIALILLYTLFHILFLRGSIRHCAKFLLIIIVLAFALTAWFILPYFRVITYTGLIETARAATSRIGSVRGFGDYGFATLKELFRILGSAGFYYGSTYSRPYFHNPFLILISYLIPLLAFSSLIFKPKSKNVIFFATVSLFFLFCAKGTNPPFGYIYKWIVNYIPFARVYRTSWTLLLGAVIGYAFLIGVATISIYNKLRHRKPYLARIFILVVIAVILTNAWPLVTGAYLENLNNPPDYKGVEIPPSYYAANVFLNTQGTEDSKFLVLPPSASYLITDWGYLGSAHLLPFIFSKPLIYGYHTITLTQAVTKLAYHSFIQEDFNQASKILGLLNVRYLLLDNSIDTASKIIIAEYPLERYREGLKSQKGIHFKRSFGKLDLYRVDNCLPHIFASSHTTLVDGSSEALVPLSNTKYLREKPCLLFLEQLPGYQQRKLMNRTDVLITFKKESLKIKPVTFKKKTPPEVSFERINPTRYVVKLRRIKEPFWLVFLESFHKGWKAYMLQTPNSKLKTQNRREWSALVSAWKDRGRRIELKEHYVVNGYANGWWIDPSKVKEIEIVLEYMPQRLVEVGILISGLTFLGCIGYLAGTGIRRKRRKLADEKVSDRAENF